MGKDGNRCTGQWTKTYFSEREIQQTGNVEGKERKTMQDKAWVKVGMIKRERGFCVEKGKGENVSCGRVEKLVSECQPPSNSKAVGSGTRKRSQSVNELRANHSEMSSEKPFQDCKSGFTKRLRGRKKEKKSVKAKNHFRFTTYTPSVFNLPRFSRVKLIGWKWGTITSGRFLNAPVSGTNRCGLPNPPTR
ncbi:hypothetical protein CEXT_240801 [Caerostris extrusa]|uniref:Uncharacterized protein n=1 Tax=Caerostris extrusa TaxID=172846 RepID=A0AAV4XDN2_CAEEX|nr:hypothetical protein CEXT_240801 [Caerostris extrusa]